MDTLNQLAMMFDASHLFASATGNEPDGWQRAVLRSDAARLLLCCGRQVGKSTVVAALALHTAIFRPDSLVLCLAPAERQSKELFRKALDAYRTLGRPVAPETENKLELELANRSRIVALPSKEATVRSFSGVDLIIIDEAARVPDDLYHSVRPMLGVSAGRLVALSTPFGRRGWFFNAWCSSERWERYKVPATDCPRISAEFLAEEARVLGGYWFAQEFCCEFIDLITSVFHPEAVSRLVSSEVPALAFPE